MYILGVTLMTNHNQVTRRHIRFLTDFFQNNDYFNSQECNGIMNFIGGITFQTNTTK